MNFKPSQIFISRMFMKTKNNILKIKKNIDFLNIFLEGYLNLIFPTRLASKKPLNMIENHFLDNNLKLFKLQLSGLNENHAEFPENIEAVEKKRKLCQSKPLFSSQVLENSYKYSRNQLQKKMCKTFNKFWCTNF